jgi:hypothetical protein
MKNKKSLYSANLFHCTNSKSNKNQNRPKKKNIDDFKSHLHKKILYYNYNNKYFKLSFNLHEVVSSGKKNKNALSERAIAVPKLSIVKCLLLE